MQQEQPSALLSLLHRRFNEAFGKPSHTLGRDNQWSLKPAHSHALPINMLVNGNHDLPAVWLFDLNNKARSVVRTTIRDEAHLEKIISLTQQRVQRAADMLTKALVSRGPAPSGPVAQA